MVSDYGIDAEIEFKSDDSKATGEIVFLQLKSGDSHLRRDSKGSEIFAIKDPRHSKYWMNQKVPVMLVIRNSDGDIRWMEIRSYLEEAVKRQKADKKFKASNRDPEVVSHIEFRGEPFNVATIRRLRGRLLTPGKSRATAK